MWASERYQVDFSSTDDPDLDAELIAIEDTPRTIDEVLEICRRYKVRARVLIADGEVREVSP